MSVRFASSALVLLCAACFNGEDALGLPCDNDQQCGTKYSCQEGFCGGPQAASGTASSTSTSASTSTSTSSTGTSTSSTGTTSDTDTDTDTGEVADPVLVGGRVPGCGPALPPVCAAAQVPAVDRYEFDTEPLALDGQGNAVAVGVGRFSANSPSEIAVLHTSSGEVTVHQWNGENFGEPLYTNEPRVVPFEGIDLGIGDLDCNGFDDIVALSNDGATETMVLDVFLGRDSAPFQLSVTEQFPMTQFSPSLAVGDITGDATPDVFVATGQQTGEAKLWTFANSTFTLRGAVGDASDSPWDAIVADFDDDGLAEVLMVGSNDTGLTGIPGLDTVQLFTGKSGSLGRVQSMMSVTSPYGTAVADFNGDGRMDYFVVGKNIPLMPDVEEESSQDSEVALCLQDGELEFTCSEVAFFDGLTGFSNARAADFNCDGAADVIIGTSGGAESLSDGDIYVLWGPIDPQTPPQPVVMPAQSIGNRIEIADVTGDGYPDALVPQFGARTDSGTSTVWLLTSDGSGQ